MISCALCVVFSDGHCSSFDLDLLNFLKSIKCLFIRPPNTTVFLKVLDQVKQRLHHECRKSIARLFVPSVTINREDFIIILTDLWQIWAPKETIVAGKMVCISHERLNVKQMQQAKFEQAAAYPETRLQKTPSKTLKVLITFSLSPMMFVKAV